MRPTLEVLVALLVLPGFASARAEPTPNLGSDYELAVWKECTVVYIDGGVGEDRWQRLAAEGDVVPTVIKFVTFQLDNRRFQDASLHQALWVLGAYGDARAVATIASVVQPEVADAIRCQAVIALLEINDPVVIPALREIMIATSKQESSAVMNDILQSVVDGLDIDVKESQLDDLVVLLIEDILRTPHLSGRVRCAARDALDRRRGRLASPDPHPEKAVNGGGPEDRSKTPGSQAAIAPKTGESSPSNAVLPGTARSGDMREWWMLLAAGTAAALSFFVLCMAKRRT